jgi:PTH1 family peptidyl-tRNA hydrolase
MAAASPVLVVGLGNPGREYASNRHNLGWMALDELIRGGGFPSTKKKFQGEYTKGTLEGQECVLLRPETYMNDSGRSVQGAVAFFHTAPRDIVVLHDELDLPFGDVRVKLGGGHAGHNGLRSIVQHLGTADFVRVRMGVGRPPPGFTGEVADYLLSNFSSAERAEVPDLVLKGITALRRIFAVGVDRAMNEANTRPKAPGPARAGGTPASNSSGGGTPDGGSKGGAAPSGSRGASSGPEGPMLPTASRRSTTREIPSLLAPGQSFPGP